MPVGNLQNDRSQRAALESLLDGTSSSLAAKQDAIIAANALGPGSVARSVEGKLGDFIDVKDYGATFDGVARTIGDSLSGLGLATMAAVREAAAVARWALADDDSFSITPPSSSGGLYVSIGSTWAHITYAATGSPSCAVDSQSAAAFAATTGALADAGGTDGKFTISSHTDGKLYFSNRTGGAVTVAWSDIQSTDTVDFFGIQRAIDLAGQQTYGGQVQMPRGRAMLNRPLYGRGGVDLVGAGKWATTLYATANLGVISGAQTIQGYGRCSYRDFTAWGYGDRASGQSSGYILCKAGWFDYIEFINVYAKYSRGLSLTAKGTYGAKARNCDVERSCRDGINFSDGFGSVDISYNTFSRIGDDAIAYHQPNASDQSIRYHSQCTIIGNQMEWCSGIKLLGARNTVIANNTGRFLTGYGVYVGYDSTFHQGQNTHFALNIADNVFTDIFNVKAFSPAQDLGGGIILVLPPASTGNSPYNLPAKPGAYNGSSALVKPDSVLNALGEDRAVAPAFGITVSRNKVIQTLGEMTASQPVNMSDWGFGTPWYNDGDHDFACNGTIADVSTGDATSVQGVFIKGDTSQIAFVDNHFYGLEKGIFFQTAASAFFGVRIRGGSIHRCLIGIKTPFTSGTACDIEVRDVDFNIDPFIKASGRTAGSGVWSDTSAESASALSVQYAQGVRVIGGTLRNARMPAYTNGTTILTVTGLVQYVGSATDGVGVPLVTCPKVLIDAVISSGTYRAPSGGVYITKTLGLALKNARKPNDTKTPLQTTAGSVSGELGQGTTTGSRIITSSTNNTSVTEECSWPVVMPQDYIPGGNITINVRVKANIARQVAQTVDFTFREQGNAGLGSDIVSTNAQTVTTSFADYAFQCTESSSGEIVGKEYRLLMTIVNNDTGGSGGAATIEVSKVWIEYDAVAA